MIEHFLVPPPGLASHGFREIFIAELRGHPNMGIATIALMVLLVAGRFVLNRDGLVRLRAGFGFVIVYGLCLVGRAMLLSIGITDGVYTWLALAGAIATLFGLISATSLVLFELAGRRAGVPRLMRDIVTVFGSLIALGLILHGAGVNLLQLVTTSAIVTAVVGLALQDTLGNIIAGVALELDGAIRIGDWIKLEDRPAGRVREIRWRATTIETRNGDLLTIPNALVNRGVLTTFASDGLEHRQWVYFELSHDHPPNRIITLVLDALVDTPNVSKQTPPDCLLISFEPSTSRYAVRYRLVDVRPDDPTDSEVRKRIWYALQRRGIDLSIPSTNVLLEQGGAEHSKQRVERDLRHRLNALSRIPLFAPLGEDGRHELAEGIVFAPYARGEAILHQNAPGDSLYIIRTGRVVVLLEANGVRKELAQLGRYDFFGEMSLLIGDARHATVEALEDTECYVVPRKLFERVLKAQPTVVEELGRLLAERQAELDARRRDLATPGARPDADDLRAKIRRLFGL